MSPIKCKSSFSDDEKLIAKRALKNQRQRERRRWAKQNQAKKKDFMTKTLYLEGELNVQQHSSWNLRQKIEFARNAYRFSSTPTKPAIQLFRTSLKTVQDMSRGVQATNLFAYLPPGFLIFFSYHACLRKPSTDPLQRNYQVQVGKCHYMVDPEPCTPYGLRNFVNCAIQASSTRLKKYSSSLRAITGQNIHIPSCEFLIGNYRNGPIIKIRYRFYYKVTQRVFPREELLTHPNYGGKHLYPETDIIR